VFEEATGPTPHPQITAEPRAEDRPEQAEQSFEAALAQISEALPPPAAVAEPDGAARFRALLERAPHHAPPPGSGEESELARRFREALEQTLQSPDDTSLRDLPSREYRE
jgi:hypothetical protein